MFFIKGWYVSPIFKLGKGEISKRKGINFFIKIWKGMNKEISKRKGVNFFIKTLEKGTNNVFVSTNPLNIVRILIFINFYSSLVVTVSKKNNFYNPFIYYVPLQWDIISIIVSDNHYSSYSKFLKNWNWTIKRVTKRNKYIYNRDII